MRTKKCTHDAAMVVEDECLSDYHAAWARRELKSFFYCQDCEKFLDNAGAIVDDVTIEPPSTAARSGASHLKKVLSSGAPLPGVRRKPRKLAERDPKFLVEVPCSWLGCTTMVLVFPQNIRDKNYCPELHRPLHLLQKNRERQKRWRAKHFPPERSPD